MSSLSPIRILAIDDEPDSLEITADALSQPDVEVLTSTDPEEGWHMVRNQRPDIVLLDLVMPKLGGMELLERIVDWDPGIDVILLTGQYSTDSAVEAIRNGACDYLTKPVAVGTLRERVAVSINRARQHRRASELEGELLHNSRFHGIVGRSPLMLEVFDKIARVAPHFQTALITGATGSGKELVARALHDLSPAAGKQFAVLNCSAVVQTLFESELFGHVKGSFTGAIQDRVGLFEYANGGTVFLDEIGDMPLATQSKLLRVLQNFEIQRVGSPAVHKVNVRVIAATHRNLPAMIEENQFREDLYYRLSMVEIELPRLADRNEDLPLLYSHFLERFSKEYQKPIRGISRRAKAVLNKYSWPGNVRQLENVLGSACMMAQSDIIDVRDLPPQVRSTGDELPDEISGETLTLADVERRHTLATLARFGGNKLRTAEALQISRATLYRILEEAESDETSAGA